MAVPVRINEDNYVKLQQEAERERRSVVSQLNVILDDRYGRNTVGNVTAVSVNGGAPIEVKPGGVIDYKGKTPPSIVPVPDVSELIQQSVTEGEKQLREMQEARGEHECCQHPSRPCKHWQWNVDQAGYVNVLSGRYREAD